MTSRLSRRGGFTLIELLIVITIIGILAVALVPRLTGGPGRARDAQRKADLQQIATALEFLADDNGAYPRYVGCVSNLTLSSYLTTVPVDPSSDGITTGQVNPTGVCGNGYTYIGLGGSGALGVANYTATGYLLVSDLETETDRGTGIYGGASAFAVTTTSSASTNFSNNSSLSCATTCTATDVYYMLGR